ncbi:MAG TPA: ATP-grasp domain-containing protein [Candidatus Saccharimonadales bacterium]|nr:ATP-grasp domain-containing protein [Candidatus Saccharimonadales bacterium]
MKRILIVGQNFSTLTDYLSEKGYDYIVLKDINRTKFPDKKLKRRVVCDFSSRESILKVVHGITEPIDAVIATYENYILPASWIASDLGLPGISPASAEACTDKFLMRSLFAEAPEPVSPDFAIVKNEETLRTFAASHEFPLMLKPANLAKSLLVTKNHNLDELLANYRRTMDQIVSVYQKYSPSRSPSLLVEEFLDGSTHSVDAFTGQDGEPHVLKQVIDYETGFDIGFDDNFTYSRLLPSKLSKDDQAALRHVAAVGIKALGITSAPSHVEIIMTKKGPRIIEIGARNGGYRERMHGIANGIDITGNALNLTLGKPVELRATRNDSCATLELLPKTPGTFTGITNEDALKDLPSLNYYSVKAMPGQYVGKAADGYKMCAIIILHNADKAQFDRDLQWVNDNVYAATVAD